MLKRLKIWQKLALISIAFAVAIPAVLYLVLSDRFAERDSILVRAEGLEYIRAINPVFQKIPQHRGQTNGYLGGDSSLRAGIEQLEPQIDADFAALSAFDSQLANRFGTSETLAAIRTRWNTLKGEVFSGLPQADSWRRHTELVADLEELMLRVSDNSGLRSDPDIGNSYLVRSIAEAFPSAVESLGQLRGLGTGYIARQQPLTLDQNGELVFLAKIAERDLADLENAVRIIGIDDPSLRSELEELFAGIPTSTRSYVQLALDEIAYQEVSRLVPTQYFAQGTATISPYLGLADAMSRSLSTQLQNRLASLRNEILVAVAIVSLAALLTLGLIILIARSITGQVARLNAVFAEIGEGRYDSRSAVTSSDELGAMTASVNTMLDNTLVLIQDRAERDQIQNSIRRLLEQVTDVADGDLRRDLEVTEDVTGSIADSFNYMLEELRDLIGGVQATTGQVTGAASQLALTSTELAEGSRRQTAEIETTAESVRLLAVSSKEVSANAETSNAVANQALSSANAGRDAVGRTIEGMGKIRQRVQDTSKRIKRLGESSQQIGEIVELISDLADRTSLLALNASIQAAAAGEAGRSFAVVAKEVEQLADRSTESTKRISQLIGNIQRETGEASAAMEETTREVVDGSELASNAGRALDEIGNVSAQLASLANDTLARARSQAEVSAGVAKAIDQIDAISRQTSGGVDLTMIKLKELSSIAQKLRDSVAAFRLPEDSTARSAA